MSIETPPTAPSRTQDAATFNTNVEAYLQWLEDDFIPGVNALAVSGAFDASLWVSGTTYTIGQLVWSPTDYAVYRRITNGAGTTDPSADGTNWAAVISQTTTTVARQLENLGLSVTMAANAVTIALKGANGSDPSSSNKVGVGFRNATITNGQASKVQVTSGLSTTISSGSTGGTVSAEASRIWIGAILVAGAVELAWFNARSGTSIAPINEGGLISTTAEGGAGAADSAQTWYSTTARSNVPVTILGYFDSTQATAGTWASSPTSVVVNPRYRPGDIIQRPRTQSGSVSTGTTQMVLDDTIPQNTEGDQYLSQAITPTSASNLLDIKWVLNATHSNASYVFSALYQDSTANALAATGAALGYTNAITPGIVHGHHAMLAGTASSTTFKVRAGENAAGTTTVNGASSARLLGGVMASSITIEEICS